MKTSRQKIILDIIKNNDIDTQNQLLEALAKRGVKSTQATISRDIKELRLVKELTPRGVYRYAVNNGEILNHSERLTIILKESLTSIDHAQNMIVIKTLPGLASAVCSAIDNMNVKDIVGTLAGDDTAFIVMRSDDSAKAFCTEIEEDIM
ncbi:MAG: arginine repressor [Oscillospiraceae bacterium]|nr:arginine repressor [Oscillospiraceae bacterium]